MNINEYEFNTELLNEGEIGSGEFESNEQELVNELMEVSSEQEFENFLGNIWKAIVNMSKSPQGKAIKTDFISGAKQFGKKMMPSLGKNLGGYFGSARDADYGGQLGDVLGGWLFDNENEAADYVKIIRNAAGYLNKALNSGSNLPSRTLVTNAINTAARPYLRKRGTGAPVNTFQTKGKWIRKGNQVILLGVR